MSSQIHYSESVCADKLKVGKPQLFNSNYYLLPIYYNPNKKKGCENDSLIIKTPRLFIPYHIKKINNRHFVEISLTNVDKDITIFKFKNLINDIERRITKVMMNKKSLKCSNKEFISILKDDNYNDCKRILLPVNLYISACFDINNKSIEDWKYRAPTYGFFVILIKNVWIKDNKWGINIFTHGGLILPSQIMDPPQFEGINKLFEDEYKLYQKICEDEKYSKFFKMKKMGVPVFAIKQKIKIEGLNENIIDYPDNTYIADIPELANCNKETINIERSNSITSNTSSGSTNLLSSRKRFGQSMPNIPEFQEKSMMMTNNSLLKINASDLMSQSMRLKKISKSDLNLNKRRKTIPTNYKNMRVPSLEEITVALKRMKSKRM